MTKLSFNFAPDTKPRAARGARRAAATTTVTELKELPLNEGVTIEMAKQAAKQFADQISFRKAGGLMPFAFPSELDYPKRTATISAFLVSNPELTESEEQVVYIAETRYGNKLQCYFEFNAVTSGNIEYNGKRDDENYPTSLFKVNLGEKDLDKLTLQGEYNVVIQERLIDGNPVMFGTLGAAIV